MLLDDWRPSSQEWFDASRPAWVYLENGDDPVTRHNGASGHELVLQTLSDASGVRSFSGFWKGNTL